MPSFHNFKKAKASLLTHRFAEVNGVHIYTHKSQS